METFAVFTKHAAPQFAAQSQKQPLEVFLAGIPAACRARVTAHMNLVSLTDLSTMQRMHQTAKVAQALLENEPALAQPRVASGATAIAGQEVAVWQPNPHRAHNSETYPYQQPPRNMRKPQSQWHAEDQARAIAHALSTLANTTNPAANRASLHPAVEPSNAFAGQDARAPQTWQGGCGPPPSGSAGAGVGARRPYNGCFECGGMDHISKHCQASPQEREQYRQQCLQRGTQDLQHRHAAIAAARSGPNQQRAPGSQPLRLEGAQPSSLATHAAQPGQQGTAGPSHGAAPTGSAAASLALAPDRDPEEEQIQRFYANATSAVYHALCTTAVIPDPAALGTFAEPTVAQLGANTTHITLPTVQATPAASVPGARAPVHP